MIESGEPLGERREAIADPDADLEASV
jgi:hypothetical protein